MLEYWYKKTKISMNGFFFRVDLNQLSYALGNIQFKGMNSIIVYTKCVSINILYQSKDSYS